MAEIHKSSAWRGLVLGSALLAVSGVGVPAEEVVEPRVPGEEAATPQSDAPPGRTVRNGAAAADDERIHGQLNTLAEQIDSLDTWLSDADQQRSQWLAELREKDRVVAAAAQAVAASDDTLAELADQLAELRAERRLYRTRQRQQADRIGKHLATSHRLRGEGFLKLLLDQRDPARVERLLVYHRHLIDARMQAYESFERASAQLERSAEVLAARRVRERDERQRLITRQEELQRSRAERTALIAALERDVENKQSNREALLADRQRLRTLLAGLRTQTPGFDGAGFAARRGSLPWPLDGVVANRFGEPRADGRMTWHGLLLNADPGSPIRAVFRGRVVFAEWMRGFGLLTILDHGDGFLTLYGHADRLTKRHGDLVESGEIIAQAGQSGGLGTSGLYFEIRQNGDTTDPLGWLAG